MVTIDPHDEKMFPTFSPSEVDRLRRFGEIRRYASGEPLFATGDTAPGIFVIISGSVRLERHDPLGRLAPMLEEGPGQFLGELGQLSGGPALVDVQAVGDVEALLIPREHLRALLIEEAKLSDKIMQALLLRRVGLIEMGTGGPVLIGPEASADMVRLQGFLARNGYPHQVLDPAQDPDVAKLVQRYAPDPRDLPLAVSPKGAILRNPTEQELAQALGMVPDDAPGRTYDVAIVGAGPAGLATAVYAASEGLSVVVLDARAFGGQAGESARIENYLGFPTGISGRELAARAFVQAQKFGAEMLIPAEVVELQCLHTAHAIKLADGRQIRSTMVVVASGAHYRRPDVPHLRDFEGRGVWYWASPIEARLCRDEEVVLVGGGNSAGQAAVFLQDYASKVWMLVRRPSLSETMSQYLVDRIEAAEKIEVLTNTEIAVLSGTPQGQLANVRWRNRLTGKETQKPIRNLFVFIGVDPATDWLKGCGVTLDAGGFVRTGGVLPIVTRPGDNGPRRPLSLESDIANVFAVGDVRAGSVKRVGAAIGEGAAVVAELHAARAHPPVAARAKEVPEEPDPVGMLG